MKLLTMWRQLFCGLALLAGCLPSIAQDRLCDDKRSYQAWHDCLGSVMLSAGKRYEGPFRNGAPNGLGSALFTNGYRYIGQFRNGEYHGTGALVDRGLKVLQAGTWEDGKFVGGKEIDIVTLIAAVRQGIPPATQTFTQAGPGVAPAPAPPLAPSVALAASPVPAPAPALPAPVAVTATRPAPPPTPPAPVVAPVAIVSESSSVAAPRPSAQLQYASRRALVVGNDDYQSLSVLRNAVSDARAMAAALERAGYRVNLHLNLNEKGFKQALRNFRYEVQGGDEVMFFFAGHGVEIAGSNFLLPVDARVSSAFDDRDRDQIREDSVDLKRFMSELEERKTKFALAVIDACREDPFPRPQGSRSVGVKVGLAQTTPATGQMIIFSAGAGQLALDTLGDNDTSRNGVFTRVFLSEMNKPGVPIDRVLKSVRTEVSRLARTAGRTQTPAIYDQSEGDFYFRPQ